MKDNPGEVTFLLAELRQGNKEVENYLIPLVYDELRRIAARHLRREGGHNSLQPTALVHEAYLRLIKLDRIDWQSRSHFFAVSANLMRRILVDHARAYRAQKRGAGWETVTLEPSILAIKGSSPDVLAIDQALDRLAQLDQRQSKIVELRFFAGMTEEETGHVLGISVRTVKRDWQVAKAWLYHELKSRPATDSSLRPD